MRWGNESEPSRSFQDIGSAINTFINKASKKLSHSKTPEENRKEIIANTEWLEAICHLILKNTDAFDKTNIFDFKEKVYLSAELAKQLKQRIHSLEGIGSIDGKMIHIDPDFKKAMEKIEPESLFENKNNAPYNFCGTPLETLARKYSYTLMKDHFWQSRTYKILTTEVRYRPDVYFVISEGLNLFELSMSTKDELNSNIDWYNREVSQR